MKHDDPEPRKDFSPLGRDPGSIGKLIPMPYHGQTDNNPEEEILPFSLMHPKNIATNTSRSGLHHAY